MKPLKIYLFCGKRKCGKDHVTDMLYQRLSNKENAVIIKISAPIKHFWAELKGLDYQLLLGSGSYKENFRKEMIEWSENKRKEDYGIFCRRAVEMFNAMDKPLWIVSDVRRKSDIRWFKENYGNVATTVKIVSDRAVRESRGWVFEEGIDDQETECDLDDLTEWDLIFTNNDTSDPNRIVNKLIQDIELCIINT